MVLMVKRLVWVGAHPSSRSWKGPTGPVPCASVVGSHQGALPAGVEPTTSCSENGGSLRTEGLKSVGLIYTEAFQHPNLI